MKPACFVGARWSWHRDFPCTIAKTGVYQRPAKTKRPDPFEFLTPLNSPRGLCFAVRVPPNVQQAMIRKQNAARLVLAAINSTILRPVRCESA